MLTLPCFTCAQFDPYQPELDWFTNQTEIHPLSSAPEPKRRFIPSKWEEKKCVPPCVPQSCVPACTASVCIGASASFQHLSNVCNCYRIVRLVRALRKGWIKAEDLKKQAPLSAEQDLEEGPAEEPPLYLMWADDGQVADKVANGLTYLPPPRMQLPGHEESYNPPAEYLPTDVRHTT